MNAALRNHVRRRAGNRCEYCHLSQEEVPTFQFHVEHIIPRQQGGTNQPQNLAWACHHCNLHKSCNLTGIDPETHRVTRLFNPRKDQWTKHFRVSGAWIRGLTSVGRTTVRVMEMNAGSQRKLRVALLEG